jgi:hypothetical protein
MQLGGPWEGDSCGEVMGTGFLWSIIRRVAVATLFPAITVGMALDIVWEFHEDERVPVFYMLQ